MKPLSSIFFKCHYILFKTLHNYTISLSDQYYSLSLNIFTPIHLFFFFFLIEMFVFFFQLKKKFRQSSKKFTIRSNFILRKLINDEEQIDFTSHHLESFHFILVIFLFPLLINSVDHKINTL